jgi:hypothetical protein
MQELSDDQFYEALEGEDHLGLVIRAQIHIEHWVEKLLGLTLAGYSKYAKELNAEYETKVLLACMAGLTGDLKAPLSAFGKLRNRFAHRPNYKLSATDAENIYNSLSATHKDHLQRAYKAIAKVQNTRPASYSKLSVPEKVCILAMLLRSKLKKACAQAGGA